VNATRDDAVVFGLTRREFMAASSLAAVGALSGCATNPLTGRRQLMFYGSSDELEWDHEASPHQFSADYGAVQDDALNAYLDQLSREIAVHSHRPNMPYTCRCVNASYVNGYTFPAGSMGLTRGILLNLENEDELAALLGHEIAHVNGRHVSQAMTKHLLITGAVVLVALAAETQSETAEYSGWILGLGAVGAGLLLARYSRVHEREADRAGLDYMVKAGYNPDGMVGLMAMLKRVSGEKPWLVIRLFSSHPWSGERYTSAVKRAEGRYVAARAVPIRKERYMDMTASIRRAKDLIEAIQEGDDELSDDRLDAAQSHYLKALRFVADDYEALLKTANCKMLQKRPAEALNFAMKARSVYPAEPQALHLSGMVQLEMRRYDESLASFSAYAAALPGNPYTIYYCGRSYDGLGRKPDAAEQYKQFLDAVDSGEEADYARQRLMAWGYLKQEQE
jgi:beta-barrel assembly-enhancing protease